MTLQFVRLLVCATALAGCKDASAPRDAGDASKIARGRELYSSNCAACHGAKLEGQPDWRKRLPNGRFPAPPHDESGHSWHHTDEVLFAITKNGLVPPNAPADYESDMPAFAGKLSDEEIWAVLAYIKSHWTSKELLELRAEMTRNSGRK